MFNYKYNSEMTLWAFDDTKQEFKVSAEDDIKRGQEVKIIFKTL